MKNKSTALLCVFMCIVLVFSTFVACGKKGDNADPTALTPDENWRPGVDSTYEPVTVDSVELADIVSEALGDEAKDFNGDLSTLTAEQLKKVEELAAQKGLKVEVGEEGKPVMKDPSKAEASDEEVKELYTKAGIADPSHLSDNDKKKLAEEATKNGMVVVTKKDGGIDVQKPIPSTTRAPFSEAQTAKKPYEPTKAQPGNGPAPTAGNVASMGTTLVKTSLATCTWKKAVTNGKHDIFTGSAAVEDGVVCVGSFTSAQNAEDTSGAISSIIYKYDNNGKLDWSQKIKGNKMVNAVDVAVLSDGSIVVCGTTQATNLADASEYMCMGTYESFVAKYDHKGNREWLKIYGGSQTDQVYAIAATPDGGFVFGGNTSSTDGHFKGVNTSTNAAFTIKCDADGNVLWKNALCSVKHCAVEDYAVAPDGNIYAALSSYSADGDFKEILAGKPIGRSSTVVKISADGNILWKKGFYETGTLELSSIEVAPDGGCVVAGNYTTDSKGKTAYALEGIYNGGTPGTNDGIILKLSPDGKNVKWKLPLIGFENDFISDIVKVPGGYAVSGYSASSNRDFKSNSGNFDAFVYVISEYGSIQTSSLFGGENADTARTICGNGSTTVFIGGSTNSTSGFFADCDVNGDDAKTVAFAFKIDLKQG